jgi:two-component system C4-dicarboxylate transport response regulator DctD
MEVLFVDDDIAIREAVQQWLSLSDIRVTTCKGADEALQRVRLDFEGVVVSDVRMPGRDGLQLLDELLARDIDLPVIMVTAHGDVPMAVDALHRGAYDFIEKPFTPERLLESLRRAQDKRRLTLENRRLRRQVEGASSIDYQLMGISSAMVRLREQVKELARTEVNVLIRGETGSGKERVARCLHNAGQRAGGAFVAVNCAAIPESIFESELFGHESGAFTGAQGRRIGRIEHASGGSLFLDEIESMPIAQQAKLLRVIQECSLERLGSNRSIAVNLKVISAAKPDLLDEVGQGRFREDLFYRLNVAELFIPPLRDRREDIPLLFEHFVTEACKRHGREARALPPSVLSRLLVHDWPGNVRELVNAAERHVLGLSSSGSVADTRQSLAERVETFEAQCLHSALLSHRGNITAVMDELRVPRRTLNEKMLRHGLNRNDYLPPGSQPDA